MEITASQAAAEAYEYIKQGKTKVIFGSHKIKKEKKKYKIKHFIFLIIMLFLVPFLFSEKKYKIQGAVTIQGNLTSCQLNFLNKENYELIRINSNDLGKFEIKLNQGFYKIYLSDCNCNPKFKNPNFSPLAIKLNRNLENIRIHIN